jgi:hypothetical protein
MHCDRSDLPFRRGVLGGVLMRKNVNDRRRTYGSGVLAPLKIAGQTHRLPLQGCGPHQKMAARMWTGPGMSTSATPQRRSYTLALPCLGQFFRIPAARVVGSVR